MVGNRRGQWTLLAEMYLPNYSPDEELDAFSIEMQGEIRNTSGGKEKFERISTSFTVGREEDQDSALREMVKLGTETKDVDTAAAAYWFLNAFNRNNERYKGKLGREVKAVARNLASLEKREKIGRFFRKFGPARLFIREVEKVKVKS